MDVLRLLLMDTSAGPWLMFAGELNGPFEELRKVLHDLSGGLTRRVEFHAADFVRPLQRVRLTVIDIADSGPYATEGWTADADSPGTFTCQQTRSSWADDARRLDSLCEATHPCHQYLSPYATNATQMVVSKGEYDLRRLEQSALRLHS